MRSHKKLRQTLKLTALNIFFILLCGLALIPILYAFSLSIGEGSGALSSGNSFFPEKVTLENYRRILKEEPFLIWFLNSVKLSVGTMILAMEPASRRHMLSRDSGSRGETQCFRFCSC